MKKTLSIFFALIILLCGCTETKKEDNDPISFTDDIGQSISITSPQKTAVLLGSYADIWTLAGGIVCAAPDDAWKDLHLDLPADTVNLGGTKNLSLEKLFSSQPDFVIASTGSKQHTEWKETLQNAGIPVAYFNVITFDDYLRMLSICTDITGRKDLYEKYGTNQKSAIDNVLSRSVKRVEQNGRQSVLYLRASASVLRAKNSNDSVMGEMLKNLGCDNIADSDSSLLEALSLESILAQNPYRIFIVQVGDDIEGTKKYVENVFKENPAWNELDAVKNGRVHFMDKMLYNLKPNARWSEAYEKLENILENE